MEPKFSYADYLAAKADGDFTTANEVLAELTAWFYRKEKASK